MAYGLNDEKAAVILARLIGQASIWEHHSENWELAGTPGVITDEQDDTRLRVVLVHSSGVTATVVLHVCRVEA